MPDSRLVRLDAGQPSGVTGRGAAEEADSLPRGRVSPESHHEYLGRGRKALRVPCLPLWYQYFPGVARRAHCSESAETSLLRRPCPISPSAFILQSVTSRGVLLPTVVPSIAATDSSETDTAAITMAELTLAALSLSFQLFSGCIRGKAPSALRGAT